MVQIGTKGRLAKLKLTGGNMALQSEVRVAMNLSRFAAECQGQAIEFVFTFKLEDPATSTIVPPAVHFVPPNRFILTFRRVRQNIETAPTKVPDAK
jgi:hypothetical protein